jgi:hypothetical protein
MLQKLMSNTNIDIIIKFKISIKALASISQNQHDSEALQEGEEMEPTEKNGAQSSVDNQMEDGTPKGPKHTQGTQKSLEIADLDDEDDNPAPCPKESKHQKQSKKKATVIDTDHFLTSHDEACEPSCK